MGLLYNGITTYWHVALLRIKRLLYHNNKIGKSPRLCGIISFKLNKRAFLSIGYHTAIVGGGNINTLGSNRNSCLQVDEGAILTIGDYSGMSNVSIWSKQEITIGNYVTIGAGTIINDSNNHCTNYKDRRKEHTGGISQVRHKINKAPIIIEDDVFIGARCIICKSVHIGARSIIAAGSVVVKDIPEDEIWGGNPAKFIRKIEYESSDNNT